MAAMAGKYKHYKNEDIDGYFSTVGVPYVARKMIAMSSPTMEISTTAAGVWSISNTSLLRTVQQTFTLGEPYDEHMPSGVVKSVTTMEEGELVTRSTVPPDTAVSTRRYTFSDDECVVTLTHEKCKTVGRRYFKRIKE